MSLPDEEVRHLAIELLTAPTARDEQQRIGASNLSNPCDFCLASNLMGDMRETPMLNRAWGGRVLGTAIHSVLEHRMNKAKTEFAARKASALASIGERFPGALVEHHMTLGTLGTYGEVGSTSDLVLPSCRHAVDWKGTTKTKNAILSDYLQTSRGLTPNYGRTHKNIKLSEKAYAEEMKKKEYQITGYYMQLQLYMRGLNLSGIPISRASNVFISRDDTMWFDNPGLDRYDDPSAAHGITVLSFDYNESYANEVWARGLSIWEALENGRTPNDFARHTLCFTCQLEARDTITPVAVAA